MSETVIESVPLHDYPEYRDGCVEVLCEEWGRSRAARLAMLEKSSPNLPCNIALLERLAPDSKQVIGHSRLCRVYGQQEAAFVESVVVRKRRRNQGLGRKLMDETEQHARRLGIRTIYLSTHDKQDFYSHLGYEYCTPVVSSGAASAFLTEKLSLLVGRCETPPMIKNSFPKSTEGQLSLVPGAGEIPAFDIGYSRDFDQLSEAPSETESINLDEVDLTESTIHPTRSRQPPPPPPPTPLAGRAVNCDRKEVITRISVFWMKKELIP